MTPQMVGFGLVRVSLVLKQTGFPMIGGTDPLSADMA